MKKLIGIDLGTVHSAVSYLDDMGKPHIIHNNDGDNLVPSVVSFEDKATYTIGIEAKKDLDNKNRFEMFKRDMGFDKKYKSSFGQEYTPTDLSSLILKDLFKIAKSKVGDISEAVVTVPANFTNQAREATLEAGKMAGFNVNHIINEPTAAALYYSYTSKEKLSGNYAFYDLGGGTFDVSIVKIFGDDIKILASEGVAKLGGRDFDKKLQEVVFKKYKDKTGDNLPEEEYDLNKVEEDKKSLSKRESIKLSFGRGSDRVQILITKKEFETAISALVTQAEILCESAVKQSGLDISDIKAVFLVGGSTRVPFVRESINKVFKKEPISRDNPDEVVSLGASVYCGCKTDQVNLNPIQKAHIQKVDLQEITNHYFGTIVVRGSFEDRKYEKINAILISKGSKIPCSKSETFETIRDGQSNIECEVTQSSHEEIDPSFVNIIWKGDLELPQNRPAGQKILITYSYDSNQIMNCEFLDVASGIKKTIDLNINKKNGQNKDLKKLLVG